jgi:hypothetical protein
VDPIGLGAFFDGDYVLVAEKDDGFESRVSSLPGEKKIVFADDFVIELGVDLRESFFEVGVEGGESLLRGLSLGVGAVGSPGDGLEWDGAGEMFDDEFGVDGFGGVREGGDLFGREEECSSEEDEDEEEKEEGEEFEEELHGGEE